MFFDKKWKKTKQVPFSQFNKACSAPIHETGLFSSQTVQPYIKIKIKGQCSDFWSSLIR